MSVQVSRKNVTTITAEIAGYGNRYLVEHVLWMARELQDAVDAGMPTDTEVVMRNESGVNGLSMRARADIAQEIP